MQDRAYEKKKQTILRFIKKHGKMDHLFILNEVNIDYDTLMRIISDLRNEGRLDKSKTWSLFICIWGNSSMVYEKAVN